MYQSISRKEFNGYFDTQIGLVRTDIFCVQKPFEICRCRIGRVQLCERGSKQKNGGTQVRLLLRKRNYDNAGRARSRERFKLKRTRSFSSAANTGNKMRRAIS